MQLVANPSYIADGKVGFTLFSNQNSYILYFDTAKECNLWSDSIAKIVANLEKNLSTLKSMDADTQGTQY